MSVTLEEARILCARLNPRNVRTQLEHRKDPLTLFWKPSCKDRGRFPNVAHLTRVRCRAQVRGAWHAG